MPFSKPNPQHRKSNPVTSSLLVKLPAIGLESFPMQPIDSVCFHTSRHSEACRGLVMPGEWLDVCSSTKF